MSDAGDRLAKTRLAIVQQIHGRERRHESSDARRERIAAEGGDPSDEEQQYDYGGSGWFAGLKRAANSWWRQHPAHMGLELATPALSHYARHKPGQFLAIAAVVGAVLVVARPWRLISATGLLVALLKSSQLSSVVMSAMSGGGGFGRDAPRRRR